MEGEEEWEKDGVASGDGELRSRYCMGCNLFKGSRLEVKKLTFNLNIWIKKKVKCQKDNKIKW